MLKQGTVDNDYSSLGCFWWAYKSLRDSGLVARIYEDGVDISTEKSKIMLNSCFITLKCQIWENGLGEGGCLSRQGNNLRDKEMYQLLCFH